MQRCLELALLGKGAVSPNPLVGCVIVHQDTIIGEGWHQRYGEAHAEVNAIASVADKALLKEATVYVNLEPCSHFGKTPPCADLLINHQVKQVVVGMIDPFEAVSGRGLRKLQEAGIQVTTGVLEDECKELNKRFITFTTQQRPYVILKWAQTNDAKMAPDASQLTSEMYAQKRHITGPLVQAMVHKWRGEEDAILVGSRTVVTDNPMLNTRVYPGKNPLRITIDKSGNLPLKANFFDGSQPTLVFTERVGSIDTISKTEYVSITFAQPVWPQILKELYARKVQSVIIEGGAYTLHSVIESGLWDEAEVFSTDAVMGLGVTAPTIVGSIRQQSSIENSRLTIYKNQ